MNAIAVKSIMMQCNKKKYTKFNNHWLLGIMVSIDYKLNITTVAVTIHPSNQLVDNTYNVINTLAIILN